MRRVFQVDVLRCRRSAATVVDFPKYGTRLVQKHGTPKRELSPLRDELKLTQAGRRAEAVGREISADERTVVELARPVSGGREERGEDGFRYGPVLSTRAFIPATLGRSR
jgi:hypothetical protein